MKTTPSAASGISASGSGEQSNDIPPPPQLPTINEQELIIQNQMMQLQMMQFRLQQQIAAQNVGSTGTQNVIPPEMIVIPDESDDIEIL
jgi:hypothetical protein